MGPILKTNSYSFPFTDNGKYCGRIEAKYTISKDKKTVFPEIVTERLVIRPFTEGNEEKIISIINEKTFKIHPAREFNGMLRLFKNCTDFQGNEHNNKPEDIRDFIIKAGKIISRGCIKTSYAILNKNSINDDSLIGYISWNHKPALYIDPKYRRKSYGSEAALGFSIFLYNLPYLSNQANIGKNILEEHRVRIDPQNEEQVGFIKQLGFVKFDPEENRDAGIEETEEVCDTTESVQSEEDDEEEDYVEFSEDEMNIDQTYTESIQPEENDVEFSEDELNPRQTYKNTESYYIDRPMLEKKLEEVIDNFKGISRMICV